MKKLRKWLRKRLPRLHSLLSRHLHEHAPLRRRILVDARRNPALYTAPGLSEAIEKLRRGTISVFCFDGSERFDTLEVTVNTDAQGYPWVDHGGRRLYFRPGTTPERVARGYRNLLREQHAASPHFYRPAGFTAREGDVLLDVGAAEGIWALEGVEFAARVIVFESDPAWRGALERTFAPWGDKVTIVPRFASDTDDEENTRLDTVIAREGLVGPFLLKIDVEGAESRVLDGAAGALARPDTRAVVCTYHRAGDHERLSEKMRAGGYTVATSPGWMLFVFDRAIAPPFFRRGLIYCSK